MLFRSVSQSRYATTANGGIDFTGAQGLENKNAPFNQDLLSGSAIHPQALQSANPALRHTGLSTAGIENATNLSSLTQELSYDIDKLVVTAQTRALRAGYSVELAQDMKAIHGLSAEQELINIMTSESFQILTVRLLIQSCILRV